MKSASFVLGFWAVVVVACGGSVATEPGASCAECELPSTFVKCSDGTTLGAKCVVLADGTCGAKFPECPAGSSTPPSGGTPGSAGGACGAAGQAACGAGTFCKFDRVCGGLGTCAPKAVACPDIYDPVCGCDGKNYANTCDAEGAGANVASKGECPLPEGAACGGRGTRGACVVGTFCRREIADLCGEADAPGTCTTIPTGCGKNLDPTCGCDGKTYTNPCEADRASVSARSAGDCP